MACTLIVLALTAGRARAEPYVHGQAGTVMELLDEFSGANEPTSEFTTIGFALLAGAAVAATAGAAALVAAARRRPEA